MNIYRIYTNSCGFCQCHFIVVAESLERAVELAEKKLEKQKSDQLEEGEVIWMEEEIGGGHELVGTLENGEFCENESYGG